MIALNIITGPSFLGGLLIGLNQRSQPDFKHDPWAPYKLLSLTSTLGVLRSMANDLPPVKERPGKVLASALVASPLLCGSIFCMGLMLTKIPLETKPQTGVRISMLQ